MRAQKRRCHVKVLFLDFDGVLNSSEFLFELGEKLKADQEAAAYMNMDLAMIDKKAVALLNQVVEQTHCQIVVSSTWRMGRTRHDLQGILMTQGFQFGVFSSTPVSLDKTRGEEIGEWLLAHEKRTEGAALKDPVTNFAIVDDDADDIPPYSHRLVQTNREVGLTQEDVDRLIQMLRAEF